MSSNEGICEIGEERFQEAAKLLSEALWDFDGACPEDFELLLCSTRRTAQRVFAVFSEDGMMRGVAVWRFYDLYADGSMELSLAWIAVASDSQRHGLGSHLLRESLRMFLRNPEFANRGVAYIIAESEKDNKGAIAFHRRVLGFPEETTRGRRVYFLSTVEKVLNPKGVPA